jgi:hypothetical protein
MQMGGAAYASALGVLSPSEEPPLLIERAGYDSCGLRLPA